jgi:hypothetical protein
VFGEVGSVSEQPAQSRSADEVRSRNETRLAPMMRKVDQGLFLGFGFGLASLMHRLFGILPKFISL